MLINHYTAFIQFIAAFYFSMCFEQLIEKYFWNKRYKERLLCIIDKVEHIFNLNEEEKNEINVVFEKRQKHSLTKTRIVSFFLLLFSIFTLIYSGLEQSFDVKPPIYVPIIVLSIIFLPALFLFFNGLRKTSTYANKIEKKINAESEQLKQVINASINNDISNAQYNQILAQKFNNVVGDTLLRSEILVEVIEVFKKQSVQNIKKYISK